MRRHLFFWIVLAATLAQAARDVRPFDAHWRFAPGDARGAERPGFDDSCWRVLDVPHDWAIE